MNPVNLQPQPADLPRAGVGPGRQEVLARVRAVGVVPVLRTLSPSEATDIAEILFDAGLGVVEVPLTVPCATAVIRRLQERFGDALLVGAGTVLGSGLAQTCIEAGARFVVSPAFDLGTVRVCQEQGVPVFPGALTPTEILTAWQAGADMVKVFPASAVGGPSYLRAIKAPLPFVELLPTGGVSLETAGDFIRAGASALGVGNDLVDVPALRGGRRALIADRAERYLRAVAEARASLHLA
jgi:2-dehydro-3-deoxyphosphogluconate aldolase/(4S)-4-hydroxy-2-oxoglutarate aldolase